MKKLSLILMALLLCVCLFAACTEEPVETPTGSETGTGNGTVEDHTHEFASEWSSNATDHWHACKGDGCEEVADKAAHTGGAATCTAKAKCSVCGAEYGDTVAHTYDQSVVKAEALKTEKNCSSYAVYYKSCICGAISTTDTFEDTEGGKGGHDFEYENPVTVKSEDAAKHTVKCEFCDAYSDPVDCVAGEDDGDCTTAVNCVCGREMVAVKTHTPAADDGDCTTAVMCANEGCTKEAVAAKEAHEAAADDGDCTTDILCKNCTTVVTAGADAHTEGTDDGDCTTGIKCANCDQIAVVGNAAHTAGTDDGDHTTPVLCSNTGCTKVAVAGTAHTFTNGEGKCSECDVIGIKDAAGFAAISNNLAGHYVLTADIILPDITGYYVGGSKTAEFTGTLDGQGHTLTYNLVNDPTVSENASDDKSLFGTIGTTGVVKNVGFIVQSLGTVDNATRGIYNRAAIANTNNGLIENVFVDISFSDAGASNMDFRSAGMVIVNNGTINNSMINITYLGTSTLWRTDNASYVGNGFYCRLYAVCVSGSGNITNVAYTASYPNVTDDSKIYIRNNDAADKMINVLFKNRSADPWTDPTMANILENWDAFVAGGFEMGDIWSKTADGVIFNGFCNHEWAETVDDKLIATPATCQDKATYYKSCSKCGAVGTETFEAGEEDPTNHVSGEATSLVSGDNGTHNVVYTCGGVKEANVACTSVETFADCTKAETCACGNTTKAAASHTLSIKTGTYEGATHTMECTASGCDHEEEKDHDPLDSNCDSADTCACGHVTPGGTHTFDNNCTTTGDDDKCSDCQTPNTAVAGTHLYDEDCTTDDECQNEGCTVKTTKKDEHVYDKDCTTDDECQNEGCTVKATKQDAHVAGEDDGDCTTAVKCVNCEQNAIEAKSHTPKADDGDCTTKVDCGNEGCTHVAVEAKSHEFTNGSGKCANCDVIGIADADDFATISNNLAGHYVLTQNIALGETTSGRYISGSFTGTLDGQGYTISVTFKPSANSQAGRAGKSLFEELAASAVIKNTMFVSNFDLDGSGDPTNGTTNGSATIAYKNYGLIENVFVQTVFDTPGTNGATDRSAGMVVYNDGIIRNSMVDITYTGTLLWRSDLTGNGQYCRLFAVAANKVLTAGTIENVAYVASYPNVTDGGKIYLAGGHNVVSSGGYFNVNNVISDNRHSAWKADPTVANLLSNWDTFVSGGFEIGTLWAKADTAISFNGKKILEIPTGPIEIATPEDFAKISENMLGHYVLTADIDLGNITSYGVAGTFNGILDGNGYKLTYTLYSDDNTSGNPGNRALFETLSASSVIKNIRFEVTSVGYFAENVTFWGGAAQRAGIAYTNNGLIEDIYMDITFTQPGAQENNSGAWAQAALVQVNNGTINNVIVNATYTGTKPITKSTSNAANGKGQSLCIIGKNAAGGTVSNLVYTATEVTEVEGFIALSNHEATYSGTWTNVMPMNKDSFVGYYTATELMSNWDTFVSGGFKTGTLWTKDASGIKFNGNVVIAAPVA